MGVMVECEAEVERMNGESKGSISIEKVERNGEFIKEQAYTIENKRKCL